MSWSVIAEGTVDELRQVVHQANKDHAQYLPLAERLLASHLLGHAVESAAERGDPGRRWKLSANGHEYDGVMDHRISLASLPDLEPEAPTT